MPRPFEPNARLNGSNLETLRDWLEKECQPSVTLTIGYTVADLICDLDNILDGAWSDGIDAMGEDA